MIIFRHTLPIIRHISSLEIEIISQLWSSQVFCFILYNDLLEQMVFLVQILFPNWLRYGAIFVWVFTSLTAMFRIWI